MMRRAAALVVTAAAVMCQPRISAACSPPRCGPGYFVPATSSTVPANIPALSWRSQSTYENTGPRDPSLVKLTTTADPTTPLPFTATLVRSTPFYSDWQLLLGQPLVEGTSYTATDSNVCPSPFHPSPVSTFSVGPASPLPTQLGALTVAPSEVGVLDLGTGSGRCEWPVDATSAKIQLELSADALPWRDALHFETLVDGLPWINGDLGALYPAPGSNGQGRGIDLLFRWCYTDDLGVVSGLGPGVHSVAMRATLPGTNVLLVTPPISISFECPPPRVGADITDVVPEPAEQTGCGCATSDASPIAPLLLALATFAGARALRRSRNVTSSRTAQ